MRPGPGLANPGLARILISFLFNFSVRFSVYFICPSVLSLSDLKLHKT